MTIETLKDVYLDQLQDLYSANLQANEATVALARAAKDPELVRALNDGVNGITSGIENLAKLCSEHGINPEATHCRGMEGLAAEAEAHALKQEFGDDASRDAMIISQYQRMTHYAIAGYGCLTAYANRLKLDGDAGILRDCLENTRSGDERMTQLATGGINAAAA